MNPFNVGDIVKQVGFNNSKHAQYKVEEVIGDDVRISGWENCYSSKGTEIGRYAYTLFYLFESSNGISTNNLLVLL